MSAETQLMTPGFKKHARRLNDLPIRDSASRFYEMMSGAVMWDDEKGDLPFEELGWFRAALAYRTSVIIGKPRTEFAAIWEALREVAPRWPGFQSSRCTATPELVRFIEDERTSSMRSFERWDAALSGRWKPLSGKESRANKPVDPTPGSAPRTSGSQSQD